jgi:zinc/manganese transport system substrate-binding protein
LAVMMLCALGAVQAATLKVAVTHPLLADLAKQVGGAHVEVVDLSAGAKNLHQFQPGPRELARAKGAHMYLVSGKGLEPYLPKLQSILGKDRVVEVGRKIPSITYGKGGNLHACCPAHAGGTSTLDPHWWHSMDAWRRAATILADEFEDRDPANKADYAANAKAFRSKMDRLKSWAKGQLGRVGKKQRVLATSHAAFGYFCKEFGWKMLPVQGLSGEASPAPQHIGGVAEALAKEGIPAVFPETNSNPKVLATLVKQTGVKKGRALSADGTGMTIEGMFRHNVTSIVAVMAP